ncbi:MAG: hypothetical protein ABI651_16680, partial [Verrucomicrobiota bacterium]
MKTKTQTTTLFATLCVLIAGSIQVLAQGSLIGTYYVSYRYNAGGCPPATNPSTATDGNPYSCITLPPGPITPNLPSGNYSVKVIGYGPAGVNS